MIAKLRYALLLSLVISAAFVSGQSATTSTAIESNPAETSQTTATVASISSEIAKARTVAEEKKAAEPDNVVSQTALDLLNQASEQLKLADNATSETQENTKAVREAPVQLEKVKSELELHDQASTVSIAGSVPEPPTTASAEMVDQWIDERTAELNSMQVSLNKVIGEQEKRNSRLGEIPKEMAAARREISDADTASKAAPLDEDATVAQARRLLNEAQSVAATAQLKALETEQARYNAREELLPLARQLLNQRIDAKQARINGQTERLNELRKKEVAASARVLKQAAREADTSHPLLKAAASENSSITEELKLASVVNSHEQLVKNLESINTTNQRIAEQHKSISAKFDAVGYSDSLGILLRKQRSELPDVRSHREALAKRESLLANANLKFFEIQDMLEDLADPSAVARQMVTAHELDQNTSEGQVIRRSLTDLLQARKDYLQKASEAYNDYFQSLIEINASENQLVQTITAYSNFIDERILWLPSLDRVSLSSFGVATEGALNVLNPDFWKSYFQTWWKTLLAAPFYNSIGLLILAALAASRRYWKRQLRAWLDLGAKNRLAAFRPAIIALVAATAIAIPIPFLLFMMGRPLAFRYDVPVEVAALATGLVRASVVLAVVMLARVITRKRGIAEIFFVWSESILVRLRHAFNTIVWILIPTVVIVRASQVNPSASGLECSRFALVVVLLVLAALLARLFHPSNSILKGTHAFAETKWLYKLRYLLYTAVIGVPVFLAGGALMGYVYTCIELTERLNVTFWLCGVALLANELIFFWILVKRRRLAIAEAKRRREAAKTVAKDADSAVVPELTSLPEPTIDIAAISQQAGRLLHVVIIGLLFVGLWGVWADVFPALRYLDTQPLWSVSRKITMPATGGEVPQIVDKLVPVTVADALLVLLVAAMMVGALRNIPGLLNITVFQKFKVQPGERYAFNTLIRYVIILIGMIYMFYKLGLQWENIQWLAAGVSVGLGFGLQEIFANFVSGLILLFERPVRVGDIVTVGDVVGRVTQIRIRATTIVNWDHKEHLIPNKELVTKQVMNWTLSDRLVRLLINVGVNYGADYDKAREILLRIAKENPHTLEDPAPVAALEKFGNSSVDFFLAVHLPNLDNFMDVRHNIISRIEKEFSEAGISIPFPQMDVHFDPVKKE